MLCDLCPDVPEYKLYYAQSLYQAGLFEEALKVANMIEVEHLKEKVLQLQSAIYFSNEDYTASQAILLKRQSGSAQTLNDEACLLYQANIYEDSLQRFFLSLQTGFNPLTAYNAALCHYRKKEFSQSLNMIGEIIERGIRNYPELGIGAQVSYFFL
jgi:tetratricopeptide repeat protein 30